MVHLSRERIAAETRRSLDAIEMDRRGRRRVPVAILIAFFTWVIGMALLAYAFSFRDLNTAAMFFWAGLATGNAGPMYTGLWYWSRAQS
jgi:hypothetical protein